MKIAYTGSHGTGKTTKAFTKALEYKKTTNYNIFVLQEIARYSPFPINKISTEMSQLWIFSEQLRQELELSTKYDLIICDRTILDTLAYCVYLRYDSLVEQLKPFVFQYLNTYDKIIYSEPDDNYLIADGIRDIDKTFRDKIDQNLKALYKEGYSGELIYE
jgi:nicotinamide riboside kinase